MNALAIIILAFGYYLYYMFLKTLKSFYPYNLFYFFEKVSGSSG